MITSTMTFTPQPRLGSPWGWPKRIHNVLPAFAVMLFCLAGCKTSYQTYPLAQSADKSTITVARVGPWQPFSHIDIFQDGKLIGRLGAPNRYLKWQPEPGEVLIEARSWLSRMGYRLKIEPGKSYTLKTKNVIGFLAPVRLELVALGKTPDLSKMKPPRINFSQ
jgi:hypothetical protein